MYWLELKAVRSLVARHPLVTAFGISLAIHGTLFEGWRLGKRLGWWEHQATWLLHMARKKPAPFVLPSNPHQKPLPLHHREIPLTFVEVEPTVAVTEPPPDAKYYSALNTVAANPNPPVEKPVPKVDGRQTKVVRLEDVPKPNPQPLQPSLPPDKPAPEPEPKPKSVEKPIEKPGDLAKARPDESKIAQDAKPDAAKLVPPVVARPKPRTLAEARQAKAMLAGEKMKQDGGSSRRGKISFDVKATPFGAYDAAFIAAVQQRWYDLIDSSNFTPRAGKVVLEFRLLSDGRITDMKMNGNDVGELLGLLCERAVLDPAPFPKWPSDMLRMIGINYRDIKFTFYYE
jgi:hypothetical protein